MELMEDEMTGVTITGILKLSKRFQDDCEKIINNAVNKAINEPVRICKNCKWCKHNDEYNCYICHNKDIMAMMKIIVANQIMNKSNVIFHTNPLSVLLDFGCNQWKENGSDKGAIIVGGHLLEEGETIAERLAKFDSEQIDDIPNAIVDNRIVVGVTKEEYRYGIKE